MSVLVAAGWGAFAASSLVIGALVALRRDIPPRTLGLVAAFGAGVLISAVAYELVAKAVEYGEQLAVAMGLAAGAVTFFLGDTAIERMTPRRGGKRRTAGSPPEEGPAIVLGAALDAVPESIVLGMTLLAGEGISIAFLVAVFLSNLPEAIAGTVGLREGGWEPAAILRVWLAVVVTSGIAAGLGYGLLGSAPPALVAFILAFAGGAILTMIADTLVPEARDEAGPVAGLVTTLGFGLAFALTLLD